MMTDTNGDTVGELVGDTVGGMDVGIPMEITDFRPVGKGRPPLRSPDKIRSLPAMSSPPALLQVQDLTTSFFTPQGQARAVDRVSLSLSRGETLAVVGESGCGKTVLALSILGLVPDPPGRITAGSVLFDGQDLLTLSEAELTRIRGNRISMIFQEPMTSLNPVFQVGEQIAETLRLHRGLSAREALAQAVDLLGLVGIPDPGERAASYPHELSGGMRQRVMIAMALSCGPDILIADEPTTALDVTIQAQILDLMADLRAKTNAALLLITHDLGVVAGFCRRVLVMYAGRVVEEASVEDLFRRAAHPYTQGLLASLPSLAQGQGQGVRLTPISGTVPSIFALPQGCPFHPRCPKVMDRCRTEDPPMFPARGHAQEGHQARCWLEAPLAP